MARSARRSGPRADWVYRPQRWEVDDPGMPEPNFSGTYGGSISLNGGPSNATGQVLYDADAVVQNNLGVFSPASAGWLVTPSPSRTGGGDRGALIHGVDLYIGFRPSTWALGSLVMLGWRIVVAEQDPETGQMNIQPGYSMWLNVTGYAMTTEAHFANGRNNCAEGRRQEAFGDGTSPWWTIRGFKRFKRRLTSKEGLFLYLEVPSQSVNLAQVDLYCRTLVTDTM